MKSMRDLAPYQEPSGGSIRGAGPDANSMRRMPAVNPEQTFFHFDFLRALEMHRGLALGIFLAALAACLGYLALRWNSYKAQSLVYVQPAPPHLLENGQQQNWPYDANTYESYIQQQIHNVTREDVLADAVRRIPDFQNANESEQAAADRLGGNLQVDRVSTGYQISITATAGSAADAAQWANAVAESFIESATKELRSGDKERIALLGEERDRVMKELAGDRAEQETLNKQLGVAAVGSTPDPYDDQIAATRAELVKARTDNDEAAAKLMAIAGGGLSSAALDAEADQIVAADPGLVSMKTALDKRRSELISQMANLTPQHPQYKQDAQELAKINSSLEAMTKDLRAKASAQIEQRLKNDLERTSSVESRLNAQLGQMTGAAGGATPRLQRENDLATDIARLQARFTTVDEQYRNLTIDNAAPGAVYLSAPAIAPLHADRKKVYRNALIVLLAGIVFALAAALIAHNLDPRIYMAADVEQVLGFAPMALLPDLYEVGTGVAEEYMLRLAAAVEHAHQRGHLNSCIFTGVAPGAGATTVSTRVSSMLQAMGRSTALVDAVGALPEEIADPGSDLVHLPRGSRSTALLQQMTEANNETIVVTDTAPLTISGETEYLARFVDSAIVVIESGATTKAQLREVAQTLERLDVAAVGFVLNRISMAKGNAAFRRSVHAVEKHLRTQARSSDRKRPRGLGLSAADATEAAEHPAAYQRPREAVSEPANGDSGVQSPEEKTKSRKEFAAARETMFVNQPRGGAGGELPAREAGKDAPPGWQTERSMPEMGENSAGGTRDAMRPFEHRAEEADGFLPWEGEAPAAIRDQFSAHAAQAYGRGSDSFSREALVARSTSEPASPDASPIPLHLRTPQEGGGLLNNPREAAARASASPSYDDLNQVNLPAAGQSAPADAFAATANSESSRGPGWKSIPARPARGREGAQVVLGGRSSAPLTGEDVPKAWRERLRPKADAAYRAGAAHPADVPETPANAFAEDLETAQRRPDPFEEMKEARARREPLKEWWQDLDEPMKQPAAADTPAGEPSAHGAAEPVAPASDAGPVTENDEALYHAASRLSGLRNLLTSLGIQTLHQGAEQRKAEAQSEARPARTPERAIVAQPVVPDAGDDQPPVSVTARPEIIPPRFHPETVEREKTPQAPKTPLKSPRVTSWDSPDDVDTLPSRRGQYRRNH